MTDYNARGFADKFRASRPLDPRVKQVWVELLREAVPEDVAVDTALDLGAGTGRFWPALRCAWHPRQIVAVDRSVAMVNAMVPALDVKAVVADIDDEEIADYRVEAIFCSMSLHYSADPSVLCLRLRAMLNPRGVLCIRTASRETTSDNAVLGFFPTALQAELRAFPERGVIEEWLKGAGFCVRSQLVRTPAAPGYLKLVRRALRRGLPSLQLVSNSEFALGMLRLSVWAAARVIRRCPLPLDQTLLVVGVVA
ncbi:class I SAM-dependent methyltransferase [Arthrobacter sp. S2(2024)]|uniref:class I SAM-dependent methyltransferase n=1 Tax=Arthrobacter sp. S2(2024) TaxID=3111911 RepID=UPI002FC60D5A